ncbi:MAG: alpha-mannosidase, partial [Eubacterium sp.]|nr:alpha-mannosidase [Eubacterium sp.]
VVRLYECHNKRTSASVKTFGNINEVWECDLMENRIKEIPGKNNCFGFEIKPFEIKTFLIK